MVFGKYFHGQNRNFILRGVFASILSTLEPVNDTHFMLNRDSHFLRWANQLIV